ncbi:hypothetical protein E2C01_089284 [Portunus trituberculatus]|uniref:Uncharacterized protein n=1 Tax=Portunus trituberculatus TaxID=210409 RepID=A0A5B7JD48_PORTR|nr:hypothetical protein [Portunus trituberculatus]
MALRWPALALLLLGALLGVSLATEINSQRQPQRALSSSDIQQNYPMFHSSTRCDGDVQGCPRPKLRRF